MSLAAAAKRARSGRPRGAIGSATLPEILEFLNAVQVRATYGAVGEVLGLNARAVVAPLGDRGVEVADVTVISSEWSSRCA